MTLDSCVSKFLAFLLVIILILLAEFLMAGFFDDIYKRIQRRVEFNPDKRQRMTILISAIAVALIMATLALILPRLIN